MALRWVTVIMYAWTYLRSHGQSDIELRMLQDAGYRTKKVREEVGYRDATTSHLKYNTSRDIFIDTMESNETITAYDELYEDQVKCVPTFLGAKRPLQITLPDCP